MASSQSRATQPLILVRSSVNIDETYRVPHIVRPGETLSSTSLVSRSGGKGANVSAALGLQGAQVYLCGAVGKDADWPVEELEKRGVKSDAVLRLDRVPTGRAIIQIADDGENSIVLLPGANFHREAASTSDPATAFKALPRPPTHLVLQNEIPLEHTKAFLSYAHAKGVTTIFNPSPMLIQDKVRDFAWDELNVLIVNEGEGADLLEAFGVRAPEGPQSVLDALNDLKQLAKLDWIVLTRGSKGVIARVRLSDCSEEERAELDKPSVKPKEVKDTTGAGDTFAGNLIHTLAQHQASEQTTKLLKRKDAEHVLEWAVTAASMAVEVEGALESIPKRQEVQHRWEQAWSQK
ncbi:Ribokinase [Ceraceosorus bombacis]|uniref:Ribokinase n=1 Tax=Ceraceosorus bombacis TaxID=401625 RepID=A0A0N7L9D7_9BASI|nr:Ribokinase [Ceraceosorus bombacis]